MAIDKSMKKPGVDHLKTYATPSASDVADLDKYFDNVFKTNHSGELVQYRRFTLIRD